ncbi:MAG TPA: hypothetical protein VEH84_13625 [Alphaproteobacteria bacterium]|nr:hypothetical protein [Alphaproteobacteria bacterium]
MPEISAKPLMSNATDLVSSIEQNPTPPAVRDSELYDLETSELRELEERERLISSVKIHRNKAEQARVKTIKEKIQAMTSVALMITAFVGVAAKIKKSSS